MMNSEELERLVSSYLKHLDHHRMPVPATREERRLASEEHKRRLETDEHFEAWEELDSLCHEDPEGAFAVILQLVKRCEFEDLSTLGPGPIESVFWKHAAALADRIEQLIKTDDRFFEAYQYVRMGGVPLTLQRRLNDVLVERGVPREAICEFPESYDFEADV